MGTLDIYMYTYGRVDIWKQLYLSYVCMKKHNLQHALNEILFSNNEVKASGSQ